MVHDGVVDACTHFILKPFSIDELAAIRAAVAAVALIALMLALGLAGVALMLGYMEGSFHWALAAVPAAAWLLTLIGALVASHSTLKEKVKDVKEELDTDLKLLRLSKAASHD